CAMSLYDGYYEGAMDYW
nr:immunoglobulin heavy chain junction region [Mus musculus]